MTEFEYTALDKSESFVKGKIEEKNQKAAVQKLEQEGLLIINIKSVSVSKLSKLNRLFDSPSRLDRIFFTRHLATMLDSGIALDQALKISAEQMSNERFRMTLNDMHQRVQKGESLNVAMSRHPKYFNSFYISMIKMGEKSGKLDDVLAHLLEQQENDYELLVKARSAMIYPAIIVTALFLMVILMMLFVIPKVTGILTEYDVDLPLATKILIGTNNFIINYGLFILPVVIFLVYLFRRWTKSKNGKYKWDGILLNTPYLKGILIEFNVARLTRSLSALLKSGVSFDEAVGLAGDVSNNSHYRESFHSSIKFLRKGVSFNEVMRGYPELYPPITTRMIEIGEQSGKLDYMLTRLATFYQKSVTNTLSNLASVIEPVLLLFVGLAVAFVAISVLTPIWKFSETI